MSIGEFAFDGCTSLPDITIPNWVTWMGTYVFKGCSSLSSVTWGTGMTRFPDGTFENCSSLANLKIPHWITSIGNFAFFKSGMKQAIVPYGVTQVNGGAFA